MSASKLWPKITMK